MIISFIGGGNMASALIGGLLESGETDAIRVADPNDAVRSRLSSSLDVSVHETAIDAVNGADVVVLAVKPQIVRAALAEPGPTLTPNQTLVSVAAGTTLEALHALVAPGVPTVRTMPNTPALLGLGITGLCADDRCGDRDRDAAELVMGACGETVWLEDEALMDVVTAVSGSGPAYYYLFTEALADAGTALGLPRETALRLARHTARGAGVMAAQEHEDIVELRRRVTSPGGTTQAAIESFETGNLRDLVADAAEAAVQRGRELAKEADPS